MYDPITINIKGTNINLVGFFDAIIQVINGTYITYVTVKNPLLAGVVNIIPNVCNAYATNKANPINIPLYTSFFLNFLIPLLIYNTNRSDAIKNLTPIVVKGPSPLSTT
jgi:hypothetical protein